MLCLNRQLILKTLTEYSEKTKKDIEKQNFHFLDIGSKIMTKNVVPETKNVVSGTKNTVTGTKNTVSGTKNTVSGTKTTVSGTKKAVLGTNFS